MQDTKITLHEFIEALYAAQDLDSAFQALECAVLKLGFEHLSYTYIPDQLNRLLSQLSPVFKLSSQYRTDFIDHYQDANFGQHDFTIKKMTQGELTPISWWDTAKQEPLEQKELNVIEVARNEYGLRHGVTIPVYAAGGSVAGLSVTSPEQDKLFALLYEDRIGTLTLIARMFSDRVLQLPANRALFFNPFLDQFSSTEKQVLTLLAQGSQLKQIAFQLQLDYKYLSNAVIPSLRKKFGNVTRDQLMYEAGRIQFADMLEPQA